MAERELNPQQQRAIQAIFQRMADQPIKKGGRTAHVEVRFMMLSQVDKGTPEDKVREAMRKDLTNTATLGLTPWSRTIGITAASLLTSEMDLSDAVVTFRTRLAREKTELSSFGHPTQDVDRAIEEIRQITSRRTPPEPTE